MARTKAAPDADRHKREEEEGEEEEREAAERMRLAVEAEAARLEEGQRSEPSRPSAPRKNERSALFDFIRKRS